MTRDTPAAGAAPAIPDPAIPDPALVDIVDYVLDYRVDSPLALETARHCLIDTIGCGLEALEHAACTRLLGPLVPGLELADGVRIPGTAWRLDPVQAAFNIGTMIRWLDYNDTWLAAEWGHPSDNLGAILASADWLARQAARRGGARPTMRDVLVAMVKAHEIQGCLALENAFNRVGLDHVLLVKVASTAVAGQLFGLSRQRLLDAVSQAWIDGHALRTYRQAPNTGSRKSWAAGDATSRAVRLVLITAAGEMGYPTALTAPRWGFQDVCLRGAPLRLQRPYGSYVMENVLFKIAFPAEFHAQTAVECAIQLHGRLAAGGLSADAIDTVTIRTHEACLRIIDKQGPLRNPADRDHCVQYMVAVALLRGNLEARDYDDDRAADPRIDALRARIHCVEDAGFSADYLDPARRSIANGLTIRLKDGTQWDEVVCEYPLGHRRRRAEGLPLLEAKFRRNLARRFDPPRMQQILDISLDPGRLEAMPVDRYVDLYAC